MNRSDSNNKKHRIMKIGKIALSLMLITGISFSIMDQSKKNIKPTTVIFETDLGGDSDDVLALQITNQLNELHEN